MTYRDAMKIIYTFCCLSQIAGNRILENGLGREICIHKTSLTQNARRQAEVNCFYNKVKQNYRYGTVLQMWRPRRLGKGLVIKGLSASWTFVFWFILFINFICFIFIGMKKEMYNINQRGYTWIYIYLYFFNWKLCM